VNDHEVMSPSPDQAVVTCADGELLRAPHCPGVYRFYNGDNALLYVGKSIDIATRVRSHFGDAREPGRQQQMMRAVRRIDCQLTAGETGALLLENAAIKEELPLYNRRQRRNRKLWTIRLSEDVSGFLRVVPSDFCPGGERFEAVFGLFRSRQHIDTALRTLARDQRLCLRVLGAERGRGPCFQHQIGRCAGACAGREDPQAHNSRLLEALERQRIAAWPFAGPVLLHEASTGTLTPGQPRRHYHLLHHWSYQGSFENRRSAGAAARRGPPLVFDRDAYRIVLSALRQNRCELLGALDGGTLDNPLQRSAA
jgi:excinuclease Cho